MNSPAIARHVHWCLLGDGVFVLDLAAGRFLGLNAATSGAFLALVRGAPTHPAYRDSFAAQGWLAPLTGPPTPARLLYLRAAVPTAMALVLAGRRHLARHGLAPTLRWALAHGRRRAMTLPLSVQAFRRAEALLPGPRGDTDCLPRSISLFALLRVFGHDPVLVIGVRRFPFSAHAWIEGEDGPLLEADPRRPDGFTPILRIGRTCPDPF